VHLNGLFLPAMNRLDGAVGSRSHAPSSRSVCPAGAPAQALGGQA
jgi:hypothetical protein